MLDRIRSVLSKQYFAVALFCFWLSFLVLPTSKAVNNVFYALVALPGVFLLCQRWRMLPWRNGVFCLFLIWLTYNAASAVVLRGDVATAKDAVYVFLFYAVILVGVNPAWWQQPLLRRAAFGLASSYVLLSCIFLWLGGSYGFGEKVMWLPARMTGPIMTSMFLVSLWALAAEDWIAQRRFAEMLLGAAAMLFCIVFAMQSRSGLLGFTASLTLLLLRWRLRPALFVLAAAGALLLVYLGLAGGMDTLRDWSFVARGDSGRFEVWRNVLAEMQQCGAIFGCGYSHTIQSSLQGYAGTRIAHSHSIFVAQALFGGIVGLSLLLALCGWALRCGWRSAHGWALCFASALIMLNLDGNKLVDNPDELWLLFHWPLAVLIALHAQPSARTTS